MVKEGKLIGHKISKEGIEVDHAKIQEIKKLPTLILVKRCEVSSWACRVR